MVYVLNTDGKALMPTRRHQRVRQLLKKGDAVVVCCYPFTIKLTTEKPRFVQEISLGVDSGTRHIGVSATTCKEAMYSAEAILRKDIPDLIATRREIRRTRRNRLRYRPPRFLNRVASKKKGWLPPSTDNKVEFHKKVVEYVRSLLPIHEITVEIAPFDTQKLVNPDIEGEQYQHGEQEGFYNVREYVLWRDRHTCQHCKGKSGDKVLNAHHIESRKVGGNAPNNLITLCKTCHDAYHRGGIKLKVKRGQPLRDAAGMNVMKDRLYDVIKSENLDISVRYTYGYKTKYNRVRYGISKSHASDAQVISGNYTAEPCDEFIEMRQLRRHNRQIHKFNICKGGKLKRNQSAYCVKGFRLWDVVRYRGGLWLINGKRTSGIMTITSLTDSTLKIDGVTCKKFRLVSIANRLRILIYETPVGGAIHLRN